MKNIFITTILFLTVGISYAQVGVETGTIRGDGALDFPSPATKGILLPLVNDTSSISSAGGAIAFNIAQQQVEFYDVEEGAWLPFSIKLSNQTVISGPEHAGGIGRFTNVASAEGVVIRAGSATQNAPTGSLVIESDDKAIILPQVPNATLLPSPKAGLICYDLNSDSIAVFNGEVWSFYN